MRVELSCHTHQEDQRNKQARFTSHTHTRTHAHTHTHTHTAAVHTWPVERHCVLIKVEQLNTFHAKEEERRCALEYLISPRRWLCTSTQMLMHIQQIGRASCRERV